MIARAIVLVLSVSFSASLLAQAPPAIEGPEADIIKVSCLGCHQVDLIAAQRLSRPAWDRELAKMERWGAKLAEPERSRLLTYLSRSFGPGPSSPPDEAGAGAAVYQSACRTCHADDLAAQQRLAPAAWERTVDKMIRWGAPVPAERKQALVAFLAARWRP